MLIPMETLRRVADGRVTLAFRRWERPTVRAGETLLTAVGVLAVDGVDEVDPHALTEADARAAGHGSLEALRAALDSGPAAPTWRVALRWAGPDPRLELRARLPDADALEAIRRRFEAWDRYSPRGAWTTRTLRLIQARPGAPARALSEAMGMERELFEVNVRRLKELGLTESLTVGYRLSPRGAAVVEALGGETREPDP